MKISQEVRDFALNNPRPLGGGDDSPQASEGRGTLAPAEAQAGMAHMSQLYRDGGNELYIGAGDREHD